MSYPQGAKSKSLGPVDPLDAFPTPWHMENFDRWRFATVNGHTPTHAIARRRSDELWFTWDLAHPEAYYLRSGPFPDHRCALRSIRGLQQYQREE